MPCTHGTIIFDKHCLDPLLLRYLFTRAIDSPVLKDVMSQKYKVNKKVNIL